MQKSNTSVHKKVFDAHNVLALTRTAKRKPSPCLHVRLAVMSGVQEYTGTSLQQRLGSGDVKLIFHQHCSEA